MSYETQMKIVRGFLIACGVFSLLFVVEHGWLAVLAVLATFGVFHLGSSSLQPRHQAALFGLLFILFLVLAGWELLRYPAETIELARNGCYAAMLGVYFARSRRRSGSGMQATA